MQVKAVLFDAYGTLFDVYSIALQADALFPGQGAALSLQWRTSQIDYTRLYTLSGRYKPFWELTQDALRYACKRLNLSLTPEAQEALMQSYAKLSAFPENLAVLKALKRAGLPLGILSNGNPPMLQSAVSAAGMSGVFEWLLSVDSVQQFKTAPAAYGLGPAAVGAPQSEILFVSSNAWDACCATWYGYKTLWINRAGMPLEELGVEPTLVGKSLEDVLSALKIDS
jgi:2-haloacid dehalogenase